MTNITGERSQIMQTHLPCCVLDREDKPEAVPVAAPTKLPWPRHPLSRYFRAHLQSAQDVLHLRRTADDAESCLVVLRLACAADSNAKGSRVIGASGGSYDQGFMTGYGTSETWADVHT